MYDYKDKERNRRNSTEYMFIKSLGMFEYDGLPETIPQEELERILQENGYAFIYEHNNELYAFSGGFSGVMDMYNRPTKITINNVYLNLNETVDISDGILIRNDDYKKGLTDLYDKHNHILNENEISMIMNTINSRIQTIFSAGDDKTKKSAEKYLDDIVKGELGVIGENQVLEGLNVNNGQSGETQSIMNLIEFQQYMKASLYNEVGIDLNFNMKRERLNSGEVSQNAEMLYPLVNNMFRNRKQGIEQMNEKYNLDIGVDYGSIWKKRDTDKPVETDETDETNETNETNETDETEETEETEETNGEVE